MRRDRARALRAGGGFLLPAPGVEAITVRDAGTGEVLAPER
ncbi:hypothetical protein [Saccharopolyspora shandongensis]|nr:hypothetical protein [Saccharopolyspora shandongensis]